MAQRILYCFILGNALSDVFPVTIGEVTRVNGADIPFKDFTIGYLIIEKKNLASILNIWKVGIIEGSEEWNILEGKPNTEIDIEQELKGNKLDSSMEPIAVSFPESRPKGIVIIVQPSQPATTGKRGPEEDGSKKRKKRTYEIPDESDEGRDRLMVISPERLDRVTKFVENSNISILHSPPSSGKSALGQYLREYFTNHNYDSIYISLAAEVGSSWKQISECENATFVFIDEIQIIYGERAPFFWGKVKQLMSNYGNKNLKIFFLGAYHPILSDQLTPVQFKYALGLDILLLTREELQQFVTNYIQYHITLGSPLFNITEDIQEAIFNFTGGHPGLCRFILSQLRIHYREFLGDGTKEKILQFLASSDLRNGITIGTRAFHWILNWTPSEEETEFIRLALLRSHNGTLSIDYNSSPELED